tara:strand:+ start:254 stop:469 length:216 start_codon:yes stop_codon:yes gene_type:complete
MSGGIVWGIICLLGGGIARYLIRNEPHEPEKGIYRTPVWIFAWTIFFLGLGLIYGEGCADNSDRPVEYNRP